MELETGTLAAKAAEPSLRWSSGDEFESPETVCLAG